MRVHESNGISKWMYKPVAGLAAAMRPPTALFPSADVDEASNDSFGKMLCHIRIRVYVVCSRRSDAGDYVAEGHV